MLTVDCAEIKTIDGAVLVELNSLTDGPKFGLLAAELDTFLRESQPPRLLMDLSGAGMIPSRGLGELVRVANAAQFSKTRVFVCSNNPLVKKVIEKTQIDQLVTLCEDVEHAKEIWDQPVAGPADGKDGAAGSQAIDPDAPQPGRYGLPRNFYKFVADRERQTDVVSYNWGSMNWLAGPPMTPSALLHVARVQIKPYSSFSFHRHPDMEEVVVVTRGKVEVWIDQKSRTLVPGESATVPQNIVHALFNNEAEPADVLMINCPARDHDESTISVVGEEPWKTIIRRRAFPNLDLVWKGRNLFARVTNHKILDTTSTEQFRTSMLTLEADGAPQKFIIDFQEAWILSNTVLGVLGELQHRMSDGRRELCVCGLSDEAMKNFRKTKLSQFVTIYPTVKAALEALHREEDAKEAEA